MSITPSYESPLDAVIMRTLAWEKCVANRTPIVKEISEELIQSARFELGMKPSEVHSARQYLQTLRKGGKGYIDEKNQPVGWENEWRLLYLPPHSLTRQLSYNPIVPKDRSEKGRWESEIILRNPAIPRLSFIVGQDINTATNTRRKRGLYILRLEDSVYIGKSDEFDVRIGQHASRKNPSWWIFVSTGPEYEPSYTLDTLNATESFLISFWNEIAILDNGNRGGDQEPSFIYRQQATLLCAAVSAVWLYLMRCKDQALQQGFKNWSIPFKKRSGLADWPECYIRDPSID